VRKPDAPTLLNRLTANAETFQRESKRLEKQVAEDAARYAKGETHGDLGAFMRDSLSLSRMLKGALKLLKSWNARADYYGEEAADALVKELETFIAKLDKSVASSKRFKIAKRRGRPATPADFNKEFEERLVTAVLRDSSSHFPTRGAARHRVRKHLRAKGLRP